MTTESCQFESKEQLAAKLEKYRKGRETKMAVGALPAVAMLVSILLLKRHPNHDDAFIGYVIGFGMVLPLVLTFILIFILRLNPQAEGVACNKCGKSIADGISNDRSYTAVSSGACPACGCRLYDGI